MQIIDEKAEKFLGEYINTPSPTGFPVVIYSKIPSMKKDVHGNKK